MGCAQSGKVHFMNTCGMEFIEAPVGEFTMGSLATESQRFDNEMPHVVKLTRSFFIGATAVTVGQFAKFVQKTGYQTAAEKENWAYGAWNMNENKWDKLQGASWKKPGFDQSADHPVVDVDWFDAVAFCQWLSKKEGCHYRLPTEAEWEYCSRAGEQTPYPWGDNPDAGAGYCNGCDQTAKNRFTIFPPFSWTDGYEFTSPVTAFKPNTWRIYDPVGNVLQWCSDWFGNYPPDAAVDPTCPASGILRVLRGGAFVYGPKHCRCAFRGRNNPDFRNFYIGFRVVLEH
jgi:sulfatase modifying factor 1